MIDEVFGESFKFQRPDLKKLNKELESLRKELKTKYTWQSLKKLSETQFQERRTRFVEISKRILVLSE